ncbi:RcnB family protein [Mesorhizobium sp. A556]
MKRLVMAVVAASFLAAPMVQAQAAPVMVPAVSANTGVVQIDWKKPSRQDERRSDNRRDDNRRHVDKRKVVKKKVVVERRSNWKRGQRYSDWRRHQPVRDYSRRGLKRPGHGQEWIRVGNDYLLVGIASGLIGAMIAGR